MNCVNIYVIEFLKENNLLCANYFHEEIYEKIVEKPKGKDGMD